MATILINRLHASALPLWLLRTLDAIWCFWLVLAPGAWLLWVVQPEVFTQSPEIRWLTWLHMAMCCAAAISLIPGWLRRALTRQTSPLQISNHTDVVAMVEALGHRPTKPGTLAHVLGHVPGNEIFQLHIHRKQLVIPRLDPRLDGLTITHLSDTHFTGDIAPSFHHEVVRRANDLGSDLIAVTGDLIDKPKCLNWLGDVLGQLKAPHGVYFVLGNHDVRVHNEDGIRAALTSMGLVDLGGHWTQIEVRGCPLILAGNELPWFSPAADMRDCPPTTDVQSPLRILLSHAPDQLPWARVNDIDLMLAGHTHGGQIQLPIVGPILSPSRFGVRYASGTFFETPTLMHVSRGISGTRHLRLNAPPELTQLVLVRDS